MTVSPPREFPAIRPGFPGGQSSAGLFFVTELRRRIAEQGLQFNTIPPCANHRSNTMPQANDKTCSLIHRITDADGKPLAEISATYYNFNWQDIAEFQQAFLPPIMEKAMTMGAEFAAADASA